MKWFWKKARTIALVLCAILVVNMNTNIIPTFATSSEEVNVIFNGNGGEVTLTVNGESRTAPSCGEMFPVGDPVGATVSMGDPVWGDYTFAGWVLGTFVTVSQGDGEVTNFNPIDDVLYSTADVLAYEVPSGYSELTFLAQWPDYDGGSEGSGNTAKVVLDGNGGTVSYVMNGINHSGESMWSQFEAGNALGDTITSIEDPVFWDSTRAFVGWMACTYEDVTDAQGNIRWEYVQVPGTSIMTSEEVLDYIVPESEVRIRAQWAGDDSDYYSQVYINAYNTTFTYATTYWNGLEQVTSESTTQVWGNRLKETSDGISAQMQSIDSFSITAEPNRDDATFEGWLEFEIVKAENSDGTTYDKHVLVSNTIYTTEQMLAKAIPDYDVSYVAKWSDIATEDYYKYGSGGSTTSNKMIYLSGNGGEVNYTYQPVNGPVYNSFAQMTSWGIGSESTVGESLAAFGCNIIGGTKTNYDFAGWTVYTCDNIYWHEVEAGTAVDFGEAFVLYQIQEKNTDNIAYDKYLLTDSYSTSDAILTTAQLNALPVDKSYFAKANWTKSADVNKPVLEGLEVTYDAATNKVIFDIEAYDADSAAWRYSICFKNNSGRQYYIYENNVSENPYKIEYSAEMLQNGTYYVSYLDIYDPAGNSLYNYFDSSEHTFEVTNSPYVCPIAVASVSASKESVEVSREKSEDVTITVTLEKGKDVLVEDEYNNNRVGYLNYNYSDDIDLYLDEQGNITGTYTVDWLSASGMEYAVRACFFIEETMPDGSTSESMVEFRYDYEHEMGTFEVNNSNPWQGELNEGPVHMTEFSVIDKSTGKELENGKFFDVADNKTHTIEFIATLDKDIPENAELEVFVENSISSNNHWWIGLEKQADGTYRGELVIDDSYQYTQYVMEALVVFRGFYGHHYPIDYAIQPYFNVKNGSDFTINARDVNVYVRDENYNDIYTGTIHVEGKCDLTVEEILGGAESYAAVVASTLRADGLTCDGWVTGYWEGASFYKADDVVRLYSNQTSLYLYPSYPYKDIKPVFCYYDQDGYLVEVELNVERAEREMTGKEFFDKVVASGNVPKVDAQSGHAFLGWDIEVYEWNFLAAEFGERAYFNAVYEGNANRIYTKVLADDGTYVYIGRVFFAEEGMTVGDYIKNMPAERDVPGYKFIGWEIEEGSMCYVGDEEVDGQWKPIYVEWEEDMLVLEYGCPSLQAVYEKVDDNQDDDESPASTPIPTPVVTPAPTKKPVAQVKPVPATTPAVTEEPAILTPPGVEMSKEAVTETVAQLADMIANVDATAEAPIVVLDMKTESGEVATVVPVEILEVIKGQNVDVVLDMGGYSWTINGNDIKAANLAAINLEVKVDAQAIPSKLVETLSGGAPTKQLSLTHNGDFGFKASLSVNLGAENAGQFGNMYYYDSDGRLVFMNAGQIDEQGNASLSFSHASDYVVIVGEEVIAEEGAVYVEADGTLASAKGETAPAEPEKTEPEVAPEESAKEESAENTSAENNAIATGAAAGSGNMLPIILVVVVGVIVVIITAAVMLKKKNE